MRLRLYWLTLILSLYGAVLPCFAQQAIINMPSADITPEGQVMIMHEAQYSPFKAQPNYLGTQFITYGIGHNTELAATFYNIEAPKTTNLSLGLGAKTAVPLWEKSLPKHEIKLTAGQMIPISLQDNGLGYFTYGHGSFVAPRSKTRFSLGVAAGNKQIFDRDMVCAIASVEQPLTKSISLVAEWFSGTHAAANLIAGVIYHHKKSGWMVVGGVKIPNNDRVGEPGFVFELGRFLGGKRRNHSHH